MKKTLGIISALCLLVYAPLKANAAFGVVNGGFELPAEAGSGYSTLFTPSSYLQGWTVGGDSIDLLHPYKAGWVHTGNQSVDLSGNAPGSISQTLTDLTPGQQYTITYWYGKNTDAGTNPIGNISLDDAVLDTFQYLASGPGWASKWLTFIATDTDVKLTFSSTSGDAFGPLLDDVSITATPEPTTIVVWSGLAAIGGIVAYRRRAAA